MNPSVSLDLVALLNLLLVPAVGLLWRISTQLATVTAQINAHDKRIEALERAA
jgi:hypothetical protein